ncbi:UDP-N-acetylglucosamine--LPS N-acetylglucosamine transferase [Trichocoleus sp. FACHB-591]|uniref:MGDG synthase family glycosyltransferase n=1 Tax=Trichocoleus sp. FACHB-591 TaxID=2692872 RepID=UPI00168707C3|nr:glycosyltransferase [Trichocoleus sp. FACHB-591]MBD2096473.1 UDP-N-acetylglucosamine--LPS N-acetylglucosamine transferase [Trichocoleus sp. FACHB-591]
MTRILILYSSLGSGHVSAARALKDAFARFPDVEVLSEDALTYASSVYRNAITQLYEQLSEKVPLLYKAFYEGSDVDDLERAIDSNLTWARLERPFFRKLGQFIKKADPDVVVCVQQIPSRLLQLLDQEDEVSKPQYVVVTDTIAHSTWINYGVNGYFLPNDLSANFLVQRGVNPQLLHVTGIPIHLESTKPKTKVAVRSQHDLPLDGSIITLFGGGLNPRRVRTMVSSLVEYSGASMVVLVAGRNGDLLEAVSDLADNDTTKLRRLGMIDHVDDLIVASDLTITKAGGLITSEILARGTPMVIVDPIPGQEEQNADVIASAGAGVQLRLLEMVTPAVQYLLQHPERLAEMRQAALEIGQPAAALNIAEYVLHNWQSHYVSKDSNLEPYAEQLNDVT